MSKAKGTPRKFSEKIALLNKKEAEGNAEFARIIKEVEETTRAPALPPPPSLHQQIYYPSRSSSGSSWTEAQFEQQLSQSPAGCFEPHQSSHQQQVQQAHQSSQTHLQQHPQQLSHQQHQFATNSYHVSLQTPANVPNINIFPIEDETQQPQNHLQQHQPPVAGYRNLDCSTNQISAARSLPDIANLRVSGSLASNLGPSHSDRRLAQSASSEQCNYNNYNNQDYSHQFAGSGQLEDFVPVQSEPAAQAQQQHQQQQHSPWRCVQIRHQTPIDDNSQPETVQQQQQEPEYCLDELDPRFVQRANSTNATLIGWQNNNNNNQPASNFNIVRAKSSEVYPYEPVSGDNFAPDDGSAFAGLNNNQLMEPAYRVRSSSYNSIDNFNNRNELKALQHHHHNHQHHQPAAPPHQAQNLQSLDQMGQQQAIYTDTQGYQFYEQ